MIRAETVDVVVVGGGPAGLSAAARLARRRELKVIVLERDGETGGIPRHSHHHGYGLDLRRPLTGPQYARHRTQLALDAGVDIRTHSSAVDWAGERALAVTSPAGLAEINAGAVLLATGCRERPRSARLVPGSRPAGVYTTGSLQQTVYMHRSEVGSRAVIVGAEHVSFSALLTLGHAGIGVAAMVTEHRAHQTYQALQLATSALRRVPILPNSVVTAIWGSGRVESVEVTDTISGAGRLIPCDTVVFTGDWVPDNELSRRRGLALDVGTSGPAVDADLRTSAAGIFAAGNVLRGAETAAVAAGEGEHVCRGVEKWLESGEWPGDAGSAAGPTTEIKCTDPLAWICPNRVTLDGAGGTELPHAGRFLIRVARFVQESRIVVRQGDRQLWSGRPSFGAFGSRRWLIPNRSAQIPARWLPGVRTGAGSISVELR